MMDDLKGVFVKMTRTLGGHSRDMFILSEDLIQGEIKREVEAYLNNHCDYFGYGDLKLEQEVCHVWRPTKPLRDKVIVVLAEVWSGSGTCYFYACRNWRETKAIINHAISDAIGDKGSAETIKVKIYEDVTVLRVATANSPAMVDRLTALKREL